MYVCMHVDYVYFVQLINMHTHEYVCVYMYINGNLSVNFEMVSHINVGKA